MALLGTGGPQVCGHCGELGHIADSCPSIVGKPEEVNQIQGGFKNWSNFNSNTYHPGLRNHPNLSYGNPNNQSNPHFQGNRPSSNQQSFPPRNQFNQNNYQGGNNGGYQKSYQNTGPSTQGNNDMMDVLKQIQQDLQSVKHRLDVTEKSTQSLNMQMGQVAGDVSDWKKTEGKLPSDTKVNPAH